MAIAVDEKLRSSLVAVVGDDKVASCASDAVVVLKQAKLTPRRCAVHQQR